MNSWQEYYRSRCVSADEAVSHIKSGDKIVDGHGCCRGVALSRALVRRADTLRDVKICSGSGYGDANYLDPKYQDSFTFYSLFNSPVTRNAYFEGRSEFIPMPFSRQDAFITFWQPDVFFCAVTPPNEEGFVSMSLSVDFTRAALDAAKLVIVQVNENLPWTDGDAVVSVSDIDYFVVQADPIPEVPVSTNPGEIDQAIAANVASLINDGDTLQIGTGTVPDQVLKLLYNHKHIGLHSEMGTSGMMDLIKRGVVDNSMKTLDRGKSIFTVLGGTQEFYRFLDHNPDILMRRSAYVTNPLVIAQQKNMVSVNSAIEVDLYGQIAADMMGRKQFSGVGGQLDFMRGASMAEGGRAIICMTSTAAKGKVSRITATLKEGAAVTDTRYDSRFIVTEYGVADLWNKTVKERAMALIAIAHPDFQEGLEREFYEKIQKVM